MLTSSCCSPILRPLPATHPLSVSMDLPTLGIPYKPNPTACSPLCLSPLAVMFSRIVLVEVGSIPASFFSMAELVDAHTPLCLPTLWLMDTRDLALGSVLLCVSAQVSAWTWAFSFLEQLASPHIFWGQWYLNHMLLTVSSS